MNARTSTRKPVHRLSSDDLLERLDTAMRLWARRDREPKQLVDRALDELHQAWATVRFALGDEINARPAAAPPRSRPPVDQARRTRSARELKAADDDERTRYIVKRYAGLVRGGMLPKAAREQVAADVRSGLHLVDGALGADGRAAYAATFSEKSVARVLKRFAGR
jgi:hypothetical protein